LFLAQRLPSTQGEDLTNTWRGTIGKGTFLDITQGGRGTCLCTGGRGGGSVEQFVRKVPVLGGESLLEYRLPLINVAVINAPAADRKGNLYFRGVAQICETLAIVQAAKRNHGTVIALVAMIVAEDFGDTYGSQTGFFLSSALVDAVVVNPYAEQTMGYVHTSPLDCVRIDSKRIRPATRCYQDLVFVNKVCSARACSLLSSSF
jgi:acyl CoA:acetate/3-ketoacid CoA transferase